MKTIWFAVPIALLIALSVLAFREAELTDSAWWSCLLTALIVWGVWKYQVRIWIGNNLNPNMSLDEFNTAKPLAYLWLGMYFFLVGGGLLVMFSSQFYDFKIPTAAILGFLSLWWIKYELWGLLLCRNSDGFEVHINS